MSSLQHLTPCIYMYPLAYDLLHLYPLAFDPLHLYPPAFDPLHFVPPSIGPLAFCTPSIWPLAFGTTTVLLLNIFICNFLLYMYIIYKVIEYRCALNSLIHKQFDLQTFYLMDIFVSNYHFGILNILHTVHSNIKLLCFFLQIMKFSWLSFWFCYVKIYQKCLKLFKVLAIPSATAAVNRFLICENRLPLLYKKPNHIPFCEYRLPLQLN